MPRPRSQAAGELQLSLAGMAAQASRCGDGPTAVGAVVLALVVQDGAVPCAAASARAPAQRTAGARAAAQQPQQQQLQAMAQAQAQLQRLVSDLRALQPLQPAASGGPSGADARCASGLPPDARTAIQQLISLRN